MGSAGGTLTSHKGVSVIEDRRVNREIRARTLLVIGADGEPLGEMTPYEALRIAQEEEMDLVEVAPNARPPVCKIMDYGKFKYQKTKRQAVAKKKQKNIQLKEVKFRVKTDEHDYLFKLAHIRRFIEHGDKARVTIMFRGREAAYVDLGQKILDRVLVDSKDFAVVEQKSKLEGRNLFMILVPNPELRKRLDELEKAGGRIERDDEPDDEPDDDFEDEESD